MHGEGAVDRQGRFRDQMPNPIYGDRLYARLKHQQCLEMGMNVGGGRDMIRKTCVISEIIFIFFKKWHAESSVLDKNRVFWGY